jgi:hypothetical protein
MTIDPLRAGELARAAVYVALILLVVRYMLVPSITANFRQNLFQIRREAFLFAADGGVEFEHPAYIRVRQQANALLSQAERVGFIQTLVAVLVLGRPPLPDFEDLLDGLDDASKERLLSFHRATAFQTLRYCFLTSPVFALLFSVGVVLLVVCVLCWIPLSLLRTASTRSAQWIGNWFAHLAEKVMDTMSNGGGGGNAVSA